MSSDCTTTPSTTASHFTAAKGEDSEGGVSPYGLGLGKTLLAAYNSGFTNPDTGEADHPDELKTEDTQVSGFFLFFLRGGVCTAAGTA